MQKGKMQIKTFCNELLTIVQIQSDRKSQKLFIHVLMSSAGHGAMKMESECQQSLIFGSFRTPMFTAIHMYWHISASLTSGHLLFFSTAVFLAVFLLVFAHIVLMVACSKYIRWRRPVSILCRRWLQLWTFSGRKCGEEWQVVKLSFTSPLSYINREGLWPEVLASVATSADPVSWRLTSSSASLQIT